MLSSCVGSCLPRVCVTCKARASQLILFHPRSTDAGVFPSSRKSYRDGERLAQILTSCR